ncbi:MAG: phosphoribosylglycinamide formyltransferase [Armatimonadetes bacterium]|nr:phosphoribosylglycinamide formyltransferase [Armatimonadota bacterium]
MASGIRIGVLASGSGTNLQAIIDRCESGAIDGRVVVVISDVADAGCLDRARRHGIDAVHVHVPRTGTPEWEEANRNIVEALSSRNVDLVVMAGYMRKISPDLLAAFPGAVMNIHPALLPSFPGTHGQRDAAEYGVRIAGATVHFADEEFDRGPIIIQAAVPVLEGDDADSLAARILAQEHRIYAQAIQWFCQGRLRVVGRRVEIDGVPRSTDAALIWPPLEMD